MTLNWLEEGYITIARVHALTFVQQMKIPPIQTLVKHKLGHIVVWLLRGPPSFVKKSHMLSGMISIVSWVIVLIVGWQNIHYVQLSLQQMTWSSGRALASYEVVGHIEEGKEKNASKVEFHATPLRELIAYLKPCLKQFVLHNFWLDGKMHNSRS
jgi:hypothetical protein